MEIFKNNNSCCCPDQDMIMPYPPMHGEDPYPMPMPYPPTNGMPCPHPMPMPCPHPMPGPMPMPMPMPYPPTNGMPCPHPMPGPMPMPPMPIEDCDEETLHHMEKMYCMHMYMSAMNKAEAYKHKMMHCYCKHNVEDY